MGESTVGTLHQGADLVLSDVVSFEVRLMLSDTANDHFESLYDITGSSPLTTRTVTSYPVRNPSFSTAGPLVFDTWSSADDAAGGLGGGPYNYSTWNAVVNAANPPTPWHIPIYQRSVLNANGTTSTTTIHVKAVQVIIRVWDYKTEQTRQITIVQDM
jgi:hypothetical protein